MKKLLSRVFGELRRVEGKSHKKFRPRFEALEERDLMSVGPEFHINTKVQFNQHSVAVASQPAANGGSVAVWADQFNAAGTDIDIRAQRFDGAGNKVGNEIIVAGSARSETSPSVSMDFRGNFVVVWTDQVSSTNTDIKGQRFFANGNKNGGVIAIANSTSREFDADVAMAAGGNFVVSYTVQVGSQQDVHARRFAANGSFLSTIVVANSLRNENAASIAMSANGHFSIAYQDELGKFSPGRIQTDIRLKRFGISGGLIGTHTIANSTQDEGNPDVAMDNFGNTVVVWEHHNSASDRDIDARKVLNDGSMGLIMVVDGSTEFQFSPKVAMDMNDGDFVVAYDQQNFVTATHSLIVREMHRTGSIINSFNLGNASGAAIAINDSDAYFIAYSAFNRPGDPESGIRGRRGLLV